MGNISKEEFCKEYGMCKDKLYRYALYRLGDPNDAEDAVSDTVLAAWQGIDKLKSSEAFGSWMNKYFDKIALSADSALRNTVVISNPLGEDTSVMRTSRYFLTSFISPCQRLSVSCSSASSKACAREVLSQL